MCSEKVTCPDPDCRFENEYSVANCRCGRFLGFPNRRAAEEQATELDSRYAAAIVDATARGLDTLVGELERLLDRSVPVICMSIEAADDVTRARKYRNYHNLVDQGHRGIASRIDESDRTMIGSKLFPGYYDKIHYAALSPNGRGLSSYGDIAIGWTVSTSYLEKRISVHEENSYTFFDKNSLGRRGSAPPKGYIGVWNDRKKVGVAKLAPKLNTAMSAATLGTLVLHDSRSRAADDFMEVAIYAEQGIDTLDLLSVTVQNRPSDARGQQRLELIAATCVARGIAFSM